MSYLEDPRVFFAAERTLLAWVRTGIAVMGLGFLVAKFGLFLRYIAHDGQVADHRFEASLIIGTAMIVLGSLASALAAIQFRRFVRLLSAQEQPPRWSLAMPALFAWAFAGGGIVLALYLIH